MYDFDELLAVLRMLLAKEHFFEHPYRTSRFDKHIRPLNIFLEKHLISRGYLNQDTRRQMRLDILAYICEITHLETTYDLTIYQCTCIYWFFKDTETYETKDFAEQFLDDLAKRVEEYGVPTQESDYPGGKFVPVSNDGVSSDLPDLF
jgi:hypothetical protein